MQVKGSSQGARTLGDDVLQCTKQIYVETGTIEQALQSLGQSFRDEEYQDFKGTIDKVQEKIKDVLPTLKSIKPKLDEYAAILDDAMMKR